MPLLSLFLMRSQDSLTAAIYLTLTTINLAVPLGFFCIYMYLSMKVRTKCKPFVYFFVRGTTLMNSLYYWQFAGFPYASKYAIRRLNKVIKCCEGYSNVPEPTSQSTPP